MKIRANTAEWKWGNMQACPLYLYGNTCVLQFIKFNQMYTNPYTFIQMLRNIEEERQFSQVVVSEHWVYLSFEENGVAKRTKRKRAEFLCSVFVTRLNPWIVHKFTKTRVRVRVWVWVEQQTNVDESAGRHLPVRILTPMTTMSSGIDRIY